VYPGSYTQTGGAADGGAPAVVRWRWGTAPDNTIRTAVNVSSQWRFSQHSLAVLADSDDEGRACGLNDVVGDSAEFIGFHDPFGLSEEPVDKAEVASGDPRDGSDGLGIGEIFRVQGLAEFVGPASA
jgi:hypothetical protein